MTKQSGLGDNFYIDQYDISGDLNSLSRIGGGPTAIDVTDITQSGMDRLGGVRDGAMEFSTYFNKASLRAHPALSTLPTTARIASYFRSTVLGTPAASMQCRQINYDPNRNADGSLAIGVSALADHYGIEWGDKLTAGQKSDTSGANGTSIDYGAVSTLFGLAMYVHVFTFTGTDVTIALEDSANNSDFLAITNATSTFTGVGAVRVQTAVDATVRRYVRAVTSGTFSQATFAVNFVRYLTAPGS